MFMFKKIADRVSIEPTLLLLFGLFCVWEEAHSQVAASEVHAESSKVDSFQTTAMIYQVSPELSFSYDRPETFQFLKYAPKDLVIYWNNTFQKKNVLKIGAMAAITALLVAYDQPIYEETQKLGRHWNISTTDKTKTYISAFGLPIFRGPTDLGSTLYFIGDGWTHTGIAISFLGYGLIADDNRALQTASQLAEGLLSTGFTTQLLKHITGRESPSVADAPGGVWRIFPNQLDYHKHVPNYDAFPSGHLATAMMTLTVIAENYPEHKYIRPLGYTLLTLLSFQMVNNGVHWVSDYPLALAMGYSFGKIAVARGRKVIGLKKSTPYYGNDSGWLKSISFTPMVNMGNSNGVGIGLSCKF
jgi:hypothetical protein